MLRPGVKAAALAGIAIRTACEIEMTVSTTVHFGNWAYGGRPKVSQTVFFCGKSALHLEFAVTLPSRDSEAAAQEGAFRRNYDEITTKLRAFAKFAILVFFSIS